ncbi:MAG: serine/threonine protein kinase [Planctomycetes bacterium]|nr:serine/threonine protein kinase [Planctomycetota bacterium]
MTPEQIARLVPQARATEQVGSGGQKLVFRTTIDDQQYALKFAKVPTSEFAEVEDFSATDIALRAKREVETMRDCDSPYVVKLGPIGLCFATVDDQQLVYFTEEYVAGADLRNLFRANGPLCVSDVAKLGRQIGSAIKSLWDLGKIHRDIKPANIMRRDSTGDFVLLDAGLAFDIDGESISAAPVGTPAYFSPEQFEFSNRRTVLDFRSDLFALGVTMYYLVTGQHPFWSSGDNSAALYSKITNHMPSPPNSLVSTIPEALNDVILRLLGKSPHLRYRRCDQLIDALQGL